MMVMKCAVCDNPIAELFLKKIKGVYVKDAKGKLFVVCFDCQSKFRSKPELLKQIK